MGHLQGRRLPCTDLQLNQGMLSTLGDQHSAATAPEPCHPAGEMATLLAELRKIHNTKKGLLCCTMPCAVTYAQQAALSCAATLCTLMLPDMATPCLPVVLSVWRI